jgi:hypothetical protein
MAWTCHLVLIRHLAPPSGKAYVTRHWSEVFIILRCIDDHSWFAVCRPQVPHMKAEHEEPWMAPPKNLFIVGSPKSR